MEFFTTIMFYENTEKVNSQRPISFRFGEQSEECSLVERGVRHEIYCEEDSRRQHFDIVLEVVHWYFSERFSQMIFGA